jgi:hypothetical protein
MVQEIWRGPPIDRDAWGRHAWTMRSLLANVKSQAVLIIPALLCSQYRAQIPKTGLQ